MRNGPLPVFGSFATLLGALAVMGAPACAGNAMSSPLRHAQAAAPGATITPVDLPFPGWSFYVASTEHERVGLAVDQAGQVTGGITALQAIRPAPTTAPADLAALVNLLVDPEPLARGQGVWNGGSGADALAGPPAVVDGTLEYWRRHSRLADWVRCRAPLTALGDVTCRTASDLRREASLPADPLERARHLAALARDLDRLEGLTLAATVPGDEASALILHHALNDRSADNRKAAVKLLAQRAYPAAIADIRRVLLGDASPDVRAEAARALGTWKAQEARSDIEKVAVGDTAAPVRAAATLALKSLQSSEVP